MPNDDSDESDTDSYMITEHEIAVIEIGLNTFPGKWLVDSELDHCRVGAPRIWLRPDPARNPFRLSFGFTKEDGQFHVAIQRRKDRGECAPSGMPFGTVGQALTMCRASLLILMKHAITNTLEKTIRGEDIKRDT